MSTPTFVEFVLLLVLLNAYKAQILNSRQLYLLLIEQLDCCLCLYLHRVGIEPTTLRFLVSLFYR